ncbi:hypothetical protein CQ001_00555 [Erwinia billingiae]|nr:hypothetical protein CQ001_00555 [Erwinia billingiae]
MVAGFIYLFLIRIQYGKLELYLEIHNTLIKKYLYDLYELNMENAFLRDAVKSGMIKRWNVV